MGQRCEFKDLEGSYLRKCLSEFFEICLFEFKKLFTKFKELSNNLDQFTFSGTRAFINGKWTLIWHWSPWPAWK